MTKKMDNLANTQTLFILFINGYYFNRTPIINVKENRLLKLHRKSTTIIENICRDIELLCMCIIIVYFRLEKGLNRI